VTAATGATSTAGTSTSIAFTEEPAIVATLWWTIAVRTSTGKIATEMFRLNSIDNHRRPCLSSRHPTLVIVFNRLSGFATA
jgi:hypothetical protein